MKKLHITLLTLLGLGSYNLHSQQDDMQEENMQLQNDIQAAEQQVIDDLAATHPEIINQIIDEEDNLEENFAKIKNFVATKNKEIEQLEKLADQNEVEQVEIARLALELADAQTVLKATIEKQRAKHRKNHKLEQKIKDALFKAEQGLKNLQNKVISFSQKGYNKAQEFMRSKKVQNAKNAVMKNAHAAKQNMQKTVQSKMSKRSKKEDMDQVEVQGLAQTINTHTVPRYAKSVN